MLEIVIFLMNQARYTLRLKEAEFLTVEEGITNMERMKIRVKPVVLG